MKGEEAAERQPTQKFEQHQQIAELKRAIGESMNGKPADTQKAGRQRTETEER